MPPSKGQGHPLRLIGVYAALVALIYALIFFTADNSPQAKLGIDLQGGTRVTLTARTPDGGKPSQDSLKKAQQIIESRVNGLGVSGSEVRVDGDNVVITVPGEDGQQAKSLATTAKLYVRPVLQSGAAQKSAGTAPQQQTPPQQPATEAPAPGAAPPLDQPAPAPGEQPAPAAAPVPAPPAAAPAQAPQVAGPAADAPPTEAVPDDSAGPAAQNRVFPAQAPEPAPAPEEPAPAASTAPAAPAPTSGAPATPATPAPAGDLNPQQRAQKEIADAKTLRQSTDPQIQALAMQSLDCTKPDPLAGNDDPNLPLVACSTDGTGVYLLDKSKLDGQEIDGATANLNQQSSQWVVDVTFKSGGAKTWGQLTSDYYQKQLAFTLDSQVVSAPQVQAAGQVGGNTEISGKFTQTQAKELANTLKYGSLPLSFATSEAETVSATLGLSSLHAGLIAGGIGLIAVLLYCLAYYRMLGFLAGFSLVASGFAVYGIIVLLGRWIHFTLDLAGIAGLIIGIGMTADSFVVFFERIKDEMREGRSFRSAVPRGWARAQRTNLSGKTVSLIASVVLYILAAGQVKGFAFTLGLTTVLDVIVLYLVTAPLMMMASRSPFFAKPSVNGLGAVQQIGRERKAGARVPAGKEA
ncbi:protein translocase subunit SecD [Nocardia aurantia]|uniref:Protein translocase subunit SecD n=1 Tax=Nocardia aurantia TaxID=2585199 RepID=A0A7K0DT85_9NOCA|nr:protein translocase subunit SecD [Nocardia aurantia]MQY28971.1 Protein translocase subunit SecD [Nocardia aurantia]